MNIPSEQKLAYLEGHRRADSRLKALIAVARERMDAAANANDAESVYEHAAMIDSLVCARVWLENKINRREN